MVVVRLEELRIGLSVFMDLLIVNFTFWNYFTHSNDTLKEARKVLRDHQDMKSVGGWNNIAKLENTNLSKNNKKKSITEKSFSLYSESSSPWYKFMSPENKNF